MIEGVCRDAPLVIELLRVCENVLCQAPTHRVFCVNVPLGVELLEVCEGELLI